VQARTVRAPAWGVAPAPWSGSLAHGCLHACTVATKDQIYGPSQMPHVVIVLRACSVSSLVGPITSMRGRLGLPCAPD
jgi:hypothetical protein